MVKSPVGNPLVSLSTYHMQCAMHRLKRPADQPGLDFYPCHPRLLIVEDEAATREFLEHALRAWYRTDTAMHVQDGIRKSIDRRYDGFLVDIGLCASCGDGIDMLEYLRTEGVYADVPIIAVTGHVLPGDREHFLETGFDAYLGKPFFRGDLLTMLDRFFDHRLPDA